MLQTVVNIKNLTKTYDRIPVLNSVCLEVKSGELFGLIGPDGGGKTTLIRVLTTLLPFDSGKITVSGYDVVKEYFKIRQIIGYMPQKFSLYPDLTVNENIVFFADLFNVSKENRLKRAAELLNFSRLNGFENFLSSKLSGGMKQKLALCCALIHTPEILVLDEPTTGVDPVSRREFWEILLKLKEKGVTILISTPYMDEAAKCDRIALMYKGGVLATDSAPNLISLFRGKVIAIYSSFIQEIAGSLKNYFGPENIQIFGDRVQLNLSEDSPFSDSDYTRLLQEIQQNGFNINRVETVSPQLEDVFVYLIKKYI